MTTSEQHLEQMEREVWQQPAGPARFAAWDALFRHADAAGATAFAMRARLAGISDFQQHGSPARSLLAFSWCLAAADRDPALLGEWDSHTMLWEYKWIAASVASFPEVPLDKVMALLDDMEERYRRGGHSLHAVHQHRMVVAAAVGDLDGAEQWHERLRTAKRDELSDCRVCVPTDQVALLSAQGRWAEAIEIGEPFKRQYCQHQPEAILAQLLMPYLATGSRAKAVDAHRVGYARIRGDQGRLGMVSSHVAFCALSGNEAAGLVLIQRHLSWLERPDTPWAEMDFAAAAAAVLHRLCETGQGDTEFARRRADGSRWVCTLADLRTELRDRAMAIAARFDARNGNDFQSRRIADLMVAAPLLERLPLTLLAGRRSGPRVDPALRALVDQVAALVAAGDVAGAATARLAVARACADAERWQDAAEAGEEALREFEGLGATVDATRARHLLFDAYRGSDHHHGEARAVLAELLAVELPADLPPVETLLEQAAEMEWGEERALLLVDLAARHGEAGRSVEEFRTLCRALDAVYVDEDLDERLRAAYDRAAELATASESAAERARFDVVAAELAGSENRIEDAVALLEAAIAAWAAPEFAEEREEAESRRSYLLEGDADDADDDDFDEVEDRRSA